MPVNQTTEFVPFREPLQSTLLRTISIAMLPALVICFVTHSISGFAPVFFGAMWFSFGGHWAEVIWLNGIRFRIPNSPVVQKLGRIAFWFIAGIVLSVPMQLTIRLFDPKFIPPSLLICGAAFALIELAVHFFLMHLRGRASFYDSTG